MTREDRLRAAVAHLQALQQAQDALKRAERKLAQINQYGRNADGTPKVWHVRIALYVNPDRYHSTRDIDVEARIPLAVIQQQAVYEVAEARRKVVALEFAAPPATES